ncbi:heterogeneous nuclear ribonucleoprotein L-like isoform X3 [Xenia sp. Carnegie-2017]|uniref:heterogeneous nuclear ribonucleoprotein L-like isoform X3 n=1 Tax=Xenia sp. Carnegie-2017 TaxID=2897299 RepID=UPI001F04756C|nr:heterogeneous nuclear ribonucleoprotein L-like isoform X3 [Xenia sp. Carnegie-2017]
MSTLEASAMLPSIASPHKKAKMEGQQIVDFSESKFVKYYKAGSKQTGNFADVEAGAVSLSQSPPVETQIITAVDGSNAKQCFVEKHPRIEVSLNFSNVVDSNPRFTTKFDAENKENFMTEILESGNIPNPLHDTPPSRVIHCRAVADGTKETDLISVLQPFGKITYVALLPKIRQALVEFEDIDNAVSLVCFAQGNPIILLGRQMYVNFSKSQEIKRDKIPNGHYPVSVSPQSPGDQEMCGHILLLTIMNALYSIDVNVISQVCNPYGNVLKIVIFHKNGLQCLVEFDSIQSAEQARMYLNGKDIYPGCCTLKVEYSRAKKLNVYKNDDETWDFTVQDKSEQCVNDECCSTNIISQLSPTGMSGSQLPITNETLANISAFPTVHSILSKLSVLPAGGTSETSACDAMSSSITSSSDGSEIMGLYPSVPNSPGGLSPLPLTSQNVIGVGQHLLNPDGGVGCVLMVYGLNPEKLNCDRLFNLFCLYGNVIKIKFLTNKPGVAMIQMSDKMASEMIIKNLNGLELFECKLVIAFSKHPYIAGSSTVNTLNDGTPATVTYTENRNNRFKYIPEGQSLKNRYQPPTRMLHFFNAPRNCTLDQLKDVFITSGADSPIRGTFFSKGSAKSSSGLLEMPRVQSAAEAVVLVNHVTINPEGGGSYTLKLAFSPSSTITPSAPTVAPAVAAAAGIAFGNRSPRRETFPSHENLVSRLGPIGSRPPGNPSLLLVS